MVNRPRIDAPYRQQFQQKQLYMHSTKTVEQIDHQIDKYGQLQVGFERMLLSITMHGEEPSETDIILVEIANENITSCLDNIKQLKLLRERLV
ncbi:hypothetical protein GCM10028805_06290 [Spirosoma harenae]